MNLISHIGHSQATKLRKDATVRPHLLAQLVLLVGWPALSAAVDIDQLSVTKDGSAFVTEASFVVSVPVSEVLRAFTDFERLPELNPSITESSAEIETDGTVKVRTRIRDCVAFLCRSVDMVEHVKIDSQNLVHSIIEPGGSDFSDGSTTWTFASEDDHTRVQYRSRITPNFWLPPLFGTHLIRNTLEKQISATGTRIESSVTK